MPKIFVRPELTAYDMEMIEDYAHRLMAQLNRPLLRAAVLTVFAENIKLLKEVNEHREKLGYELLPVHESKK